MGFWKTLFQVCTGTEVFPRLMECRVVKALFHLIALTFLLALVLAWGHSCLAAPKIRKVSDRLFNEIDRLVFLSDSGVRTGKNPEKKQSYRLDDLLRFDYYPGGTLTEGALNDWDTPFGVIVMDNGLVFWAENYGESGKGKYLAAPFLLVQNPMQAETVRSGLTPQTLYEYLKNNLEHKPGQRIHFMLPELSGKLVGEYLISCLGVMVFFGSLVTILVLSAFTILFFSGMQMLFSGIWKHPPYSRILVLLIYTAFPALIISSLYSFFMIRQISAQSVFFAVYFIYYFVIFRKIRQYMNPPDDRETEDGI